MLDTIAFVEYSLTSLLGATCADGSLTWHRRLANPLRLACNADELQLFSAMATDEMIRTDLP